MSQKIEIIHIKELVLWTENPRDPIDANASNQDIVKKAVVENPSKWKLEKLAKDMGMRYDFSELPTIVLHENKPIVYDGNRRMVLGKIKHKLEPDYGFDASIIPDFPLEIPCNVCSKEVALDNVWRKHADKGSWDTLERDLFSHKYRSGEKSSFLLLEESTGIITANPHLNKRFVKEEIFHEDGLRALGIVFKNGEIYSKHNREETLLLLEDVTQKIYEKEITTRKNRGKLINILGENSRGIIENNKNNSPGSVIDLKQTGAASVSEKTSTTRRSKRTQENNSLIFGGDLYLRRGNANNLYRDIVDLYGFYIERESRLSRNFIALIRMALRLLCETAAKDCDKKMDEYIKCFFKKVKSNLDQDIKTTLANQNITEDSLVQLLHTGAHNYTSTSTNPEQTLAISIIIGAMLSVSHARVSR